jgi:hypothetical protein
MVLAELFCKDENILLLLLYLDARLGIFLVVQLDLLVEYKKHLRERWRS